MLTPVREGCWAAAVASCRPRHPYRHALNRPAQTPGRLRHRLEQVPAFLACSRRHLLPAPTPAHTQAPPSHRSITSYSRQCPNPRMLRISPGLLALFIRSHSSSAIATGIPPKRKVISRARSLVMSWGSRCRARSTPSIRRGGRGGLSTIMFVSGNWSAWAILWSSCAILRLCCDVLTVSFISAYCYLSCLLDLCSIGSVCS